MTIPSYWSKRASLLGERSCLFHVVIIRLGEGKQKTHPESKCTQKKKKKRKERQEKRKKKKEKGKEKKKKRGGKNTPETPAGVHHTAWGKRRFSQNLGGPLG